ncbi:helix-turn-helix transcriptional regulator [Salmonella enterica subsp. diarizonae]|uniref:hypothetical protein n=1 Tax=Salmonella enterica TaxID=28901 RepID=UPI0009AC3508|nr:hypothetical protein [Salmonella enterica]EDL8432073.1 helix-turn-helix transcriptional regulator [Salmonella enterica subsp. diarizonae]
MVIVDATSFLYERKFFPCLTDKEFEVMVLYCQYMSIQKVAQFLDRTDSVVMKHLSSCKLKLKTKGDYDLYFYFIYYVLHFEKRFPKFEIDDVLLMASYFFEPNLSVVARNLGIERKEVKERLLNITKRLELKDLSSMRMMFFMQVSVFI